MFTDEQLLPISALQHWQYCPRRAALVHIEGLWTENRYTVEGRHLHHRAHDSRRGELRPGLRITRGLELRSIRLGLTGKADVVEFRSVAEANEANNDTIVLIEYKRGRPHPDRDSPFQVQVCAQALCLEDMLGRSVDEAYLYFGKVRHRVPVALNPELREQTLHAIEAIHSLIANGRTPPAHFDRKCRRCSLHDLCVPKSMRRQVTASQYLNGLVAETKNSGGKGS